MPLRIERYVIRPTIFAQIKANYSFIFYPLKCLVTSLYVFLFAGKIIRLWTFCQILQVILPFFRITSNSINFFKCNFVSFFFYCYYFYRFISQYYSICDWCPVLPYVVRVAFQFGAHRLCFGNQWNYAAVWVTISWWVGEFAFTHTKQNKTKNGKKAKKRLLIFSHVTISTKMMKTKTSKNFSIFIFLI